MIGTKIRDRRIALNMTQEELAERIGYKNKSSIAKIEAGLTDIPQSKVTAFAKALGTSESYLMGWEDDPPKISAAKQELLFRVENMNDAQVTRLKKVLDLLEEKD